MRTGGVVSSCLAIVAMLAMAPAMAQVDVAPYVKNDRFGTIKISPNGDYYAATVPLPDVDKTTLAILRRADNKLTATFQLGKNTHVQDFWWVNPERVLISVAEKFGSLDQPSPTGELYTINVDGSGADLLIGWRVSGNGAGTRVKGKKAELVGASLIDDLPNDDKTSWSRCGPCRATRSPAWTRWISIPVGALRWRVPRSAVRVS